MLYIYTMEFITIKDYPAYKINEYGVVHRKEYEEEPDKPRFGGIKRKVVAQTLNRPNGYLRVGLVNEEGKKNVSVAKLVAQAFIGERPEGYQIDHIDGNKQNNHVSNLEYVTPSENMIRATKKGLNTVPTNRTGKKGEENASCTITERTAIRIKLSKGLGITAQGVADRYNVKRRLVYAIWSEQIWKHI